MGAEVTSEILSLTVLEITD